MGKCPQNQLIKIPKSNTVLYDIQESLKNQDKLSINPWRINFLALFWFWQRAFHLCCSFYALWFVSSSKNGQDGPRCNSHVLQLQKIMNMFVFLEMLAATLFFINILLGCSVSRGMQQTFSCLSKLGGTTNLIRLLFGHVK